MNKFRTIEISDGRFESNNLRYMTVKTPNLRGRGDICLFVPPNILPDQILPIVILLHGVYGSAWAWPLRTGVHLQAMKMIQEKEIPPMIIAMPSDGLWGDGSGYLKHNNYDFEKWIAEDVVDALTEKVTGASDQSPLFIGGLSMGGFGALRIGAKYSEKFKGISGHSSITSLDQMKLFAAEDLLNYSQQDKVDEDVFNTFQQYHNSLPPIRFDCGMSDLLIEYNRELHRKMVEQGIPHEYQEYPGGHEWSYWEAHIGESLRFFANLLQ